MSGERGTINNTISNFVSRNRTYIIAEIGQAHDGSLGILYSFIHALANTGIDAIKFQIHIADAESSTNEPFRKKFSYVDKKRIDYWKRMELSLDQWSEIKKECESLGLEFLATPFSNTAVNLLEKLNVSKYKIGSGDITNKLLIDRISLTKKELILSTGLVLADELDETIKNIKLKKIPFSLLQCTTKYPTAAEEIGLDWINKFKEKYNCPVGLSDHSGEIYAGLGAASLGANIIEAHVTFDKRMFGPDANASLDIEQFKELVIGVRFLEKARKANKKFSNIDKLQKIFGKSLSVNKNMKIGDIVTFDDLEGKKPEMMGISAKDYESIIGKKLLVNKKKWDFLSKEDLF